MTIRRLHPEEVRPTSRVGAPGAMWRRRRVVVLTLALPLLLAAHEKDWRRTAESHVAFARALAAEKTRFDPAVRARVVAGRIRGDCMPLPSKITDLGPADRAFLKRYLLEVCVPRVESWGEVFGECTDRIVTPKWCDSGSDRVIAEHVGLQAYFDAVTKAMPTSSPLERTNIMGVIADFLDDSALRHYPHDFLDRAVAVLVAEYLKTASPDEGFALAEPILRGAYGAGKSTQAAFKAFRSGADLSAVQRCGLDAMLKYDDPASCPGYVSPVPRKTREQIDQERRDLLARATSPASLELLRQRVDAFYALERDGDWVGSYGFLAVHMKEGGHDRESWVRTAKHIGESYPLVAWSVNPRVLVDGNVAQVVTSQTHRHVRGKDKGKEESRTTEFYWFFETGTWDYAFAIRPEDWNESRATEVTLAEVQP